MNDVQARDIEDSYSQFRILLSKLDLCSAHLVHIETGEKHHFMRMNEFFFCEKWGIR